MNFALSDDQQMIREAAQGFLAEASNSAAVRAAMDLETGFDAALWQRIGAELGWCATAIPETHGGLGLGMVELALLLEQMGRRLTCAPFFSSVALAATVLLEAGSEAAQTRWLPPIAAGGLRATLALATNGVQWDPQAIGATATRVASGWRLDGGYAHVPDGASAELLIVAARLVGSGPGAARDAIGSFDSGAARDAIGLFALLPASTGVTCTPLSTWDLTRRLASVQLDGVQLEDADRIDAPSRTRDGLRRTEALAALLLAAEQLGGAQQCLDLALAYTTQWAQFGQPLAAFQAVKHRCAEMMVRIEATRSAVYGAAALAALRPATRELVMEAGAAKAQASEAFFHCAQESLQLHGGVGFTWEYDPHLYLKRAQAGAAWLGSAPQWRERIACALLD